MILIARILALSLTPPGTSAERAETITKNADFHMCDEFASSRIRNGRAHSTQAFPSHGLPVLELGDFIHPCRGIPRQRDIALAAFENVRERSDMRYIRFGQRRTCEEGFKIPIAILTMTKRRNTDVHPVEEPVVLLTRHFTLQRQATIASHVVLGESTYGSKRVLAIVIEKRTDDRNWARARTWAPNP